MADRKEKIDAVARYKREARTPFEVALGALIALAFRWKSLGADFLWDADPVLDDEANTILRQLSETEMDLAKRRAAELIGEGDVFDSAWDAASGDMLERLDMEGSHLRGLLEVWIALAFVNGMTQGYLKILIIRYLNNPYASPLWGGLPAGLLKWGRGYQKNILDQIALIGADAILGAAAQAEYIEALEKGAIYYIRHRGSNYDCPECDALCERPIPITQIIDLTHPRCMCWNEYFFAPLPI